MMKLKINQKGITLIALIITIIVMLILVAVTVTVALNGGLFAKAEQAKTQTLRESDREELEIAKATAYDATNRTINLGDLENELAGKGWTVTITGNTATCKSSNGNEFTVEGIGEKDKDNSSELEKYFFNGEEGKTGLIEVDEEAGTITFLNDSNTILDASESLIITSFSEEGWIIVEYNGADYRIDIDPESMEDPESVVAIKGTDNEMVTKLPTIYKGTDEETRIKQYFLGYSGEGKLIYFLIDNVATEQQNKPVFKNNNAIPDASEKLVLTGENEGYMTFLYNGTSVYKVGFDNDTGIVKSVTKESTIEAKKYPLVYTAEQQDGCGQKIYVHIIDISDTEALLAMATPEQVGGAVKYKKVRPCTNIKDAKSAYSNLTITNNATIDYSEVIVYPADEISIMFEAFAYFPSVDAWGVVKTSSYNMVVNQMTINNPDEADIPGLHRNNNMSQEEINRYIELANQQAEQQ